MRSEKPSATACLIAASLGFCSHDPALAGLVNPLAAELSVPFMDTYGPPASLFSGCVNKSWARKLAYGIEQSTLPGILLHYIVRKRYLEESAIQLLNQNIRQVVVLGGGFDVLALDLHRRFPQIFFFEIDYPATQATKRTALGDKTRVKDNLIFLPVDLKQKTLAEALVRHPRYQSSQDTLFVAEGVLMYLTQKEVEALFGFIRTHSGSGSRFAFTFMEPRSDGYVNFHNRSRIVDAWMKLRGEPFAWGISRDQLPSFLAKVGFSQENLATPDVFRRQYLSSRELIKKPLAEGEYVCVARKNDRF